MHKIKVFFKNPLVRIIIILLLITVIGLWIINMSLHSHTKHGETITVPDFTGMTEAEVKERCEKDKLNYKIDKVDYAAGRPMSSVLDQQPKPDSKVKESRTIYITINSQKVPQKLLANDTLAWKKYFESFPQDAENVLRNRGFKVNEEVEFEPDISLYVLKILYNGEEVVFEDSIPEGAELTLVAGNGSPDGQLKAPKVIGLELDMAKEVLNLNGRILGTIEKDKSLKGIEVQEWVVYKQEPLPGVEIKPNEVFNLKITDRAIFEFRDDSIQINANDSDSIR